MNIALVWPATPFLIDPMVHPPLGLWSLWPVLEEAGHRVEFFDLNVDPLPEGYDAYLISGTTPQSKEIEGLATVLKRRKIIGGPHASLFPEKMLQVGYDTVVVGEGEQWIASLVENRQMRGIYRTPRITDLDSLPFPDRSQAHRYHFDVGGRDATTMFTSRGCPFSCSFCNHSIWGRWCIQRDAENVAEEVRQLHDMGYGAIMFFDDTFVLNRVRLMRICDLISPLKMLWRCFIRADLVDLDMLGKMASAGCVEVGIGIESGSQEILDTISKGTTVEQNTQAVQWCKETGIAVKAFVILGLPGESPETVGETRDWILENRPDKLDLVFYVPYPRTPITDHPEEYDINWDYHDYSQCFYKSHPGQFRALAWTSQMTRYELEQARESILKEAGIRY